MPGSTAIIVSITVAQAREIIGVQPNSPAVRGMALNRDCRRHERTLSALFKHYFQSATVKGYEWFKGWDYCQK
jgi:hypothetical protein